RPHRSRFRYAAAEAKMERLISWRGPVVVALAATASTLGWSTSSRAQSPRAAQLVDAAARGSATTSSATTGSATTGSATSGTARPAEPPGDSAGTWVSPGKDFGATRYS